MQKEPVQRIFCLLMYFGVYIDKISCINLLVRAALFYPTFAYE